MRKKPVSPDTLDRSTQTSRRKQRGLRVMTGLLAFVLLVLSVAGSVVLTGTSYASTNLPAAAPTACDTPTQPPVPTSPPVIPTTKPTAKPTATKGTTPTTTPTAKPTTPTVVPTIPTIIPTLPTILPGTPTKGPGTASAGNTNPPLAGIIGMGIANLLGVNVPCTSPTATPTNTPNTTPVVILPPSPKPVDAGVTTTVLAVGRISLAALVGLGILWFLFTLTLRRSKSAKSQPQPGGPRSWSRTRGPNPGFGPPNTPPLSPMNNGYNGQGPGPGNSGPPGMANSGFGGFSDNFIPPSPRIFPQGGNNMPPPGSGAPPMSANGFAPASPAFNAMYGMPGMPGDPFAGPPGQMGAPGPGTGMGPGGNFVPNGPDLNDPYLAEVIRQYSQKGQPPPPSPMSPGMGQPPPPSPMSPGMNPPMGQPPP